MRVAFIGTRGVPPSYSGFETAVHEIGRRMVERGHEVTVFCRTTHFPPESRPAELLGMRLRHLPALRQKHLETLSHTVLCALHLERDMAVVCMGVGNAPVTRLLEVGGRRTVFNVDGADWQRGKWGGFASGYLRTCEKLAAGGRSILVADAAAVEAYYRAHYSRATRLVPYGADPPADRGTDTLRKFGLEAGGYLLWVGRLVPENDPLAFLEGVRQAGVESPAVVVGDSTYQERYKTELRTAAPHNAVFTGFQFGAAYQQLSSHAGLFVLAASVGGTHPVLVEQMAAGNAILARDTDSNREVLGDGGLFWQTPEELAVMLRRVWPDPALRRSLGEGARARAQERYSWEKVTSSYVELCAESLERATKR